MRRTKRPPKHSPEGREKIAQAQRDRFRNNPELRAEYSQRALEQFEREGGSKARSERAKRMWAKWSPEKRKRVSAKAVANRTKSGWNQERKRKWSVFMERQWAELSPDERQARIVPAVRARSPHQVTELEGRVAAMLDAFDIVYEREVMICEKYFVDFLLPTLRIVIEADGAYWHDPSKDADRDAEIIRAGYRVVRIPESDLMGPNPLKNFVRSLLSISDAPLRRTMN